MINLENILPDSTAEILKGRKPAAIGEIRDFNGKKYRKTSNGWRLVSRKENEVIADKNEEKSSFSDDELRSDYRKIQDTYDREEKLALKEKYNVSSLKASDIENAILLQLQKNRSTKKTFSQDDLRDWSRLYPNIGTYKTLVVSLKQESQDFIDYVKSVYEEKVKKLSGKPLTMANKYQLSIYKNLRKYENEKNNEADTSRTKLIENLSNQTKEFKDLYLDQTKQFAEKQFDVKKEFVDRHKNLLNNFYSLSKEEREEKRKVYERVVVIKNNISVGKETYVNRIVEDSKRTFENDIDRIANIVRERKINEESIKVKPFNVDVKGISMKIGDGERTLYARAILAAEFSEYKRPHYRFIITESDKYKDW